MTYNDYTFRHRSKSMKAHTVEKIHSKHASEIITLFTSQGAAKEYLENYVSELCMDGFYVAHVRDTDYGWVYRATHPTTKQVEYFRISSTEMRN